MQGKHKIFSRQLVLLHSPYDTHRHHAQAVLLLTSLQGHQAYHHTTWLQALLSDNHILVCPVQKQLRILSQGKPRSELRLTMSSHSHVRHAENAALFC